MIVLNMSRSLDAKKYRCIIHRLTSVCHHGKAQETRGKLTFIPLFVQSIDQLFYSVSQKIEADSLLGGQNLLSRALWRDIGNLLLGTTSISPAPIPLHRTL